MPDKACYEADITDEGIFMDTGIGLVALSNRRMGSCQIVEWWSC